MSILGRDMLLNDLNAFKLIGRVRPTALFIELYIEKKENVDFNDDFNNFYEMLVFSDKEWSLKKLFIQIRHALYYKISLGKIYSVGVNSENAELFELAFGIITSGDINGNNIQKSSKNIVFGEHFILQAIYEYFKNENQSFLLNMSETDLLNGLNPQSRGYLWEVKFIINKKYYFPHRLMKLSEESDLLEILTNGNKTFGKSKIFNINTDDLHLITSGKSGKTTFAEFLNMENPKVIPPFIIPDNFAGPDLCFFMECENLDYLIPVFVQLKLSKSVSVTRALETTNPSYFYKNNKIEREMCMEIMNKKYSNLHIGVVIMYPKKLGKFEESVETNLKRFEKIFDAEHGKELFDQNILFLLDSLEN